MTQKEAVRELHDRVRQCFTRHKFATFGDAMSWWHDAGYDAKKLESGEQGESKFGTELMWIVSLFGPKESVDYKVMATRKVPALKFVAIRDADEDEEEKITTSPKPRARKKTRHRRRRF